MEIANEKLRHSMLYLSGHFSILHWGMVRATVSVLLHFLLTLPAQKGANDPSQTTESPCLRFF